jgi:hypothetical protein
MARKRKPDPKRQAIEGEIAKACDAFERWYTRLKRAFNQMEKAKRRATALRARLTRYDRDQEGRAAQPAPEASRASGEPGGVSTLGYHPGGVPMFPEGAPGK